MESRSATGIRYALADHALKQSLTALWGDVIEAHMHIDDGFSIVPFDGDEPVGLISAYWRELPPPLDSVTEAYIDIIEVLEPYRRQGIATEMIRRTAQQARGAGVCQLRAWSSEDKIEAIPMWMALGFGLAPATTFPRGQEVRGYYVTQRL